MKAISRKFCWNWFHEKKTQNFFPNFSEKISITTKETKPEGQYSKVSQVQFEKVQRKMVNGMVQLLLQVLMAKLKMNDGIWDKKYEIKRLILSMNVNFYYLIIANWYFFFMVSKIICRAHLFLKNQQKSDILGKRTYKHILNLLSE